MSKKLSFDNDAMSQLYKGVETLSKAVRVTLGPKGRTVLIHKYHGSPDATKDGVTVAKEVELKNPIQNMAARSVKEAANNTVELAGDGTTTTTVLTEAILRNAISYLTKPNNSFFDRIHKRVSPSTFVPIKEGSNSMDIKRGIDIGCEIVYDQLLKYSIPVETDKDIFNVARISGNNEEEIGDLILRAVQLVGRDGIILTENSVDSNSHVKLVEGISIDRGLLSPDFATTEGKSKAEYEDALVLLYNGTLTSVQELIRSVEIAFGSERALVIIADDFDLNVIKFLTTNKKQANAKVIPIKAPGMGSQKYEKLKDLAALTGCKTLDLSTLTKLNISDFGTIKKVIVTKNETTMKVDPSYKELVDNRIIELESELKQCDLDSMKDKIKTRIAQLRGKLAIIQLGARTESELREKRDRLDDAIAATKSAIEEGIIPGSGLTLLRISEDVRYNKFSDNIHIHNGVMAVLDAIKEPAIAILQNAGLDANEIIKTILKSPNRNFGFDSLNEQYYDLLKLGIIDPVKVTRTALKNASSISGVLLTTGCVIYIDEDND